MHAIPSGIEIWVHAAGGVNDRVRAIASNRVALLNAMPSTLPDFLLVLRSGVSRVEIPFTGRLDQDGKAIELDTQGSAASALGAVLSSGTLDAGFFSSLAEGPQRARQVNRSWWGVFVGILLVVLCSALGTYVAGRALTTLTVVTPRAAYLSTGVSMMTSPTSGRVSFLAGTGPVRSGEPVFGIETNNGKTVFVDATADLQVVGQSVRLGSRVTRGGAVLSISSPDPTTYLDAVVTREEAFRLGHGAVATYERLGEASGHRTEVAFAPGALSAVPIVDELGRSMDDLYTIRLPIAPDGELYAMAPVDLAYRQTLTLRLTATLEELHVPGEVARAVLTPIASISTILGREL